MSNHVGGDVSRTVRHGHVSPLRQPSALPGKAKALRAVALPLLTLVLPGSAQLVAGSRALGVLVLRVVVLALVGAAAAGVAYVVSPSLILAPVTQTQPIALITVVIVCAAFAWTVLFVDSWRLGRVPGVPLGATIVASGMTIVLIASTAGPLLYAALLMNAHREAVGAVFEAGRAAEPIDGRYNVLLIGGDAGEGRTGLRNDTMILLSIDADTGRAVQIGIPRNLENAPFSGDSTLAQDFSDGFVSSEGDPKINAVYKHGSEHPQAYPNATDPGAQAVKEAVSGATGLTVQYYILVDMHGFEAMIDALGGIQMDVHKRVPKASTTDKVATEFIEIGQQRLNGPDALWFARSRYDSSDYERMARQKCVIAAAVNQLDPANVLRRYRDIAASSSDLIATDLPQGALAEMGELALSVRQQPIEVLQLTPPRVDTGNPDYQDIHTLVRDALSRSAVADEPEPEQPEAGATGGPEDQPEQPKPDGDSGQPEEDPICTAL